MGIITGGLIAFFAGLGLAGATVFGVVRSQENAGTSPSNTSNVSYGANN